MSRTASSEPLRYRKVAQRFREQIISGTLSPGEPLPSITSLQRELGYARGTIAKALHQLAEENLVYQPFGLPYYVRGGNYQPPRLPGERGTHRRPPHATPGHPVIDYSWRGSFTNAELNALHAEGFSHPILDDDWQSRLSRHSLGWVTARLRDGQLAGFVNVAWDGDAHAFLLDTLAAATARHAGTGTSIHAMSGPARAAPRPVDARLRRCRPSRLWAGTRADRQVSHLAPPSEQDTNHSSKAISWGPSLAPHPCDPGTRSRISWSAAMAVNTVTPDAATDVATVMSMILP
jgi:hypothetical protein